MSPLQMVFTCEILFHRCLLVYPEVPTDNSCNNPGQGLWGLTDILVTDPCYHTAEIIFCKCKVWNMCKSRKRNNPEVQGRKQNSVLCNTD